MRAPLRILVAKPGLDGHDRGAIILTMGLRDAGFEVIYTGLRQSAENIVRACIQEDVDVLALSSLAGGHLHYLPSVMTLLRESSIADILVLAGGVIPRGDVEHLKQCGIREVFGPGTKIDHISSYIRANATPR